MPRQSAAHEVGGEEKIRRSATVKVSSDVAGFLAISKEAFQSLGIFDDSVFKEIEDVRQAREKANAELLVRED